MNVYVETNFILELVFEQEQCEPCEQLLWLSEAGMLNVVIPAYSLAEPHEKIVRQAKNRRELQQSLEKELRQLARTGSYSTRISSIEDLAGLLIQSNEEEQQRFHSYRSRLLATAELVPLTVTILEEAAAHEISYKLTPQDALVYSSVLTHLRQNTTAQSCFLNRNFRDFDNPSIVDELERHRCRMIPRFDHGLAFVGGRT